MPLPENPFFTGREEVLAELKKTLDERGIAALTGLGGMGKTQTAAQYAHHHRQDYKAVLWVRAESQETLFSDLSQLGARLELPERGAKEQSVVVQAVKLWLDGNEGWLLVLDNVEDFGVVRDLARKASANGHHVVITTQSQALGQIGRQRLVPMDRDLGAVLLLRRANRLATDVPLSSFDRKDAALACDTSDEVGGLPLALDQAGAYLEETGTGLGNYLALLRQRTKELLERRGGLDSDHLSVAATFLTSFEKLATQNAASAELVQATAFLAPDAIPEDIFTEGAVEFGTVLQGAASDPIKWDEAIAAAFKFSLIERKPGRLLAVHRMVQAVAKSRMSAEERALWAERVVGAVNAAFPDVELSNWSRCDPLVPHALICAKWIRSFSIGTQKAGRLLNQAAYYLKVTGRYDDVRALCVTALCIQERLLGRESLDVAVTLNNLAGLYRNEQRYVKAESLYKRALRIRERKLKPEDPLVAQSLNNLGELYRRQGRTAAAGDLFKRALAIRESALGVGHIDVAITLNNLAGLYRDLDRQSDAEALYLRAKSICEKAGNFPGLVRSLHGLGILRHKKGQYKEAAELYEQALAMRENTLGPNHPDVGSNANDYARLLQDMNRIDEAEPLMRRVAQLFEKAYGPDHPNLATSLNNLAEILQDTNRLDEAGPLMRRALAIFERSLGRDHPNTVTVRENLAVLLRKLGRDEEADKL